VATGDPRVDAVVADVAAAADQPLAARVALLDAAERALRDVLADPR
jgi:hypothetical protein